MHINDIMTSTSKTINDPLCHENSQSTGGKYGVSQGSILGHFLFTIYLHAHYCYKAMFALLMPNVVLNDGDLNTYKL